LKNFGVDSELHEKPLANERKISRKVALYRFKGNSRQPVGALDLWESNDFRRYDNLMHCHVVEAHATTGCEGDEPAQDNVVADPPWQHNQYERGDANCRDLDYKRKTLSHAHRQ